MPLRQIILATIAYADVFDYPLTETELYRWLIGVVSVRIPKSFIGVEKVKRNGTTFLFLAGRSSIVKQRLERAVIADHKWARARHAAAAFCWIPTVQLVGVTGGLSVNNARIDDDIDLFFIVSKQTLWVTRLLVTVTSDILGIRRRPNEHDVENKICLNMFMTEDALELPIVDQDLFAAHEVLQMVPLWERGGVYKQFLRSNTWVKYFLPNAWKEQYHLARDTYRGSKIRNMITGILGCLEPPASMVQLWYMQKHRTTEIIGRGVLRFHPKDARVWIKEKYAKRLKKLDIPLDNVFYHR